MADHHGVNRRDFIKHAASAGAAAVPAVLAAAQSEQGARRPPSETDAVPETLTEGPSGSDKLCLGAYYLAIGPEVAH